MKGGKILDNKINRDELCKHLYGIESSNKLIVKALKDLFIKRNDKKQIIIWSVIVLILAIIIGLSKDTISIINKIVDILNGVIIAIFGIIFTGYTFFQALIGKKSLERMMCNYEGDIPSFVSCNNYFAELMIVYVFSILINVVLLVVFSVMPMDWHLFENTVINDVLAILLIFIYMLFQFICIWEIKCFIFNIYQVFNIAAGDSIIEILNHKKD